MGWAQKKNSHSMTSNWTSQDPRTRNLYQRIIDRIQVHPIVPGKPVPIHIKTDKMPYMSPMSQHLFIISYAAVPMALHQAYCTSTGYMAGKWACCLHGNHYSRDPLLRRLIHRHGCLDGDKSDRDGISSAGAGRIVRALPEAAILRYALAICITYDADIAPLEAMRDTAYWPSFFTKLCLYGVILDFWFYGYHRACHEIPFLWKYHRTHHLTKHPTAIMSIWADNEQEIVDMIIIPFLTFATLCSIGLSLDFYEWWMCSAYVTYSEILGHCGLRVHANTPSPIMWLLKFWDADIAVEDHDLHHRMGWKKSFNYGKQTRVWDNLFSSSAPRVEAKESNVDYENVIWMPPF
ncbi:hypothetical protein LLEC1_07643 [Akanthomyces lecanii]|uniref:Fatty acid hydroxylase domain-containing protein n=1 Tax=Cordyceps confragosa TaxID=2714763 RepID=A0A179IDS3_CORDF|nr:hypothetical protein LLEC1_07643 [Akanthomyces lecanii]